MIDKDYFSLIVRRMNYTYENIKTVGISDLFCLYVLNTQPNSNIGLENYNGYFKRLTPLPPPATLRYIDAITIFSELGDILEDAEGSDIPYDSGSELEYVSGLSFRTKMDKNIRRTSIEPIYRAAHNVNSQQTTNLLRANHLDSISLSNVLIWSMLTSFNYTEKMISIGFLNSLERLQAIGVKMTALVKRHPCDPQIRVLFAELGALTGYRNPPMPGFDFNDKVRELADAGEDHGLDDWQKTFSDACDQEFAQFVPQQVEPMTFLEYLKSEKANTSGASSAGEVKYSIDGKEAEFKARKNFLLDIYTAEELETLCRLHAGKSVQKPFTKPELGKIRIAVTGDVFNYFIQSYVFYYANHGYTQAPWNSLEETGTEELERLWQTLKRLYKKYSLPWDFDKFDHQPKNFEILKIVTNLCEMALKNSDMPDDLVWATEAFLDSTRESRAVWTFDGVKHHVVVFDGVQSGIRATSVLGNLWNATITRIVRAIVDKLNGEIDDELIRGDDSALVAKTYTSCLTAYLGYNAINAKGNPQKFAILYQNTEFLRVWSDKDRNYGYVARSIPGIVQRKPWSSEPADVIYGNIKNAFEAVNITKRRSQLLLSELEHQMAIEWSRRNKQTYIVLETPRVYGGPGIMPYRNRIAVIRTDKNKYHRPTVIFNPAPSTYVRYEPEFERFRPTQNELKQIQQARMMSRSTLDDIPEIQTPLRTYEKALLRSSKVYVSSELSDIVEIDDLPVFDPLSYRSAIEKDSLFGAYKHLEREFKLAQEFKKVRPMNVMEYMDTISLSFSGSVRDLERRYGLHRSMSIGFLFGHIDALSMSDLNPKFQPLVQSIVARNLLVKPRSRGDMKKYFTGLNAAAVQYSRMQPFYQAVGRH